MTKRLFVIILLGCTLCSCSVQNSFSAPDSLTVSEADTPDVEAQEAPLTRVREEAPESEVVKMSFAEGLAMQLVESLAVSAEDGEVAIRKIYLYLVQNIFMADPVGLDAWRYLSDEPNVPIPYIENRALSPFLFQIGSCEDFASAIVMLLQAAGFEVEYVAGFTASVTGEYIDHAWAVVKLEDQWYHIDPHLEHNIIRDYRITYRYYLKSDAAMLASHRWGENLISYWSDMPEEEKENIRRYHIPPSCPESFPSLPSEPVFMPRVPNEDDVNARIQQIKDDSGRSDLPYILLNVEPPILVQDKHITPPLLTD